MKGLLEEARQIMELYRTACGKAAPDSSRLETAEDAQDAWEIRVFELERIQANAKSDRRRKMQAKGYDPDEYADIEWMFG